MNNQNEKWKITPEKARKMLAEEGMDVTMDQATEILSFLRFMAEGVVKQFLKDAESGEIVESDVFYKKYDITTKNEQKQNTSGERKIYCSTCNFLNNNF